MMLRVLALLILCCSLGCPQAAHAQSNPAPSPAPAVSAGQAQQLLNTVQDPGKRAQLVTNLQALTQVAAPAPTGPLAPDSLGAQILGAAADWSNRVEDGLTRTGRTVRDLPLLWRWIGQVAHSDDSRRQVFDAAWKLVLVLGCAVGALIGARAALRRPLKRLEAHADDEAEPEPAHDPAHDPASAAPVVPIPQNTVDIAAENTTEAPAQAENAAHHGRRLSAAWRLLRRLPAIVLHLVLDLLPVALFMLVGALLIGTRIGDPPTARRVIAEVLNAAALFLLVMVGTRLLVSPCSAKLRLVRMSDAGAAYIERWMRRLTALTVFGLAAIQVAELLGLAHAAQDDLTKLLMLVVHALLVVVVIQCREAVARRIRPRRGLQGVWAAFLNRLAWVWPWIAIFFLIATWVVWAVEDGNALARLGHFVITTVPVLLIARLLGIVVLGGLYRSLHVNGDAAVRYPTLQARATHYFPLVRGAVSSVLWVLTVVVLLQLWGFGAWTWFARTGVGGQLVRAVGTIAVTIALAVIVWEAANIALDRKISHLTTDGQLARVARLRTLMPILQTTLLVAILVLIGLTVLSEIGVNIAPLLAGAGIVGVALGFGSQKLVQDLITGLFLLLENAMQVGDTVTLAGLTGVVEHLSIRTIRLRAGDGAVHIIPFSSVSTVTNTNRGLGNAAVSVTVAYDEDLDQVGEILKAIALEMRGEDAFQSAMCSDLQLWGVDKLDGTTATIAGQIVCTDTGRWGVQREFNRRTQRRFRELGISMGVPGQVIRLASNNKPAPVAPEPAAPAPDNAVDQPPPTALGHDH